MDIGAPIRAIDRYQRAHGWLAFPLAVGKRFGEGNSGSLAATIAYYGFFSLFPLLMALTSIAGIVLSGRPDLQEEVVRSALAQFPVLGTQIKGDIGAIEGSGLTIAIGLALALWAGLGGVRATQVAMDTVWDVPRKRRPGTPASIVRALMMLVILGVFVIGGAALASLGNLGPGPASSALAFVGSAALNVALFAIAYRVLTSADVSWKDVAPGACAAGVGWTVLLTLGGWIVAKRLSSSSDVYGTFALVIGLLAWIYLGAQLTLAGAVVNVVLADRLWPRSLQGDELTDADERALRRSARQEERRKDETVTVSFDGGERDESDVHAGPGGAGG